MFIKKSFNFIKEKRKKKVIIALSSLRRNIAIYNKIIF